MAGLEVEFHIYRLKDPLHGADLDPEQAAWPGQAPQVSLVHPGFNLLNELWFDRAEEALRVVKHTAQALGLPLLSLEIELGPSQVEAVFQVTDAMTAADNMVLFRSAVKQALHRAGYHATFMCRPPFEHIMSSGWHLHQSLYDLQTGRNVFMRHSPQELQAAQHLPSDDARQTLSDMGAQYLAGLLAHAAGSTAFCTSTVNGFGRFKPNALAPQSILWGRDNRGALLRVIGAPGDSATRIENRLGEPAANPYLYMASQIYAGLDGIDQKLSAPPATQAPYASEATHLPSSLGAALQCLAQDSALCQAFGANFVSYYQRIKASEQARFDQAPDKMEFHRREYFSIFMRPPPCIFFIMSCICSNSLSKRLTSCTCTPAPMAMRRLRVALISSGLLRSLSVMLWMMPCFLTMSFSARPMSIWLALAAICVGSLSIKLDRPPICFIC